jgi:hypothetical protein
MGSGKIKSDEPESKLASKVLSSSASRALSLVPPTNLLRPPKRVVSRSDARGLVASVDPVEVFEYHQKMAVEKEGFISSSPLVVAVETGGDSNANLQRIKLEIAQEVSSLHFQRLALEKMGKDTSQISVRRVDCLGKLAKLELQIKESNKDSVNLSSDKMQKIFSLWVEIMREVAQECLPPEVMDLFFNRFATAMNDWEEKAQNALR